MSTPTIIILAAIVVVFVAFVAFSVWAWRNRKACPKCGAQNLLLLSWRCRECGEIVPDEVFQTKCYSCGSKYITPHHWACPGCGHNFFDSQSG